MNVEMPKRLIIWDRGGIVLPPSDSFFVFAIMKEIILKHWYFQVLAKFTEMTSKYTQEMQAVLSIFLVVIFHFIGTI
jgi:hypothetical protein